MNIYIDESGSINNKLKGSSFVIALVRVTDMALLGKIYKRFVSQNLKKLKEIDASRGGKMFKLGKFQELKGASFNPAMKKTFIHFFTGHPCVEVFYIRLDNDKLDDVFCAHSSISFNYTIKTALEHFIKEGLLPDEDCRLEADERNEKITARSFLENYLNAELHLTGLCKGTYMVKYRDSAKSKFVQVADVFANLYFSQLMTGGYTKEFNLMQRKGIIKAIYPYPFK